MSRQFLINKSELNRIIAGAAKSGDLNRLYWFVEMKVSGTLVGKRRPVIAAAMFPEGWLVVVPVGDQPEVSRQDADLLLECCRHSNRGRLIEFGLSLIDCDMLVGNWYEWGDLIWDSICPICGAVEITTLPVEQICGYCQANIQEKQKGVQS